MAPPVCPCCGCRLDPGAVVCPECGADERTGWAQAWGEVEPGEEEPFEYESYVRREFGPGRRDVKPEGVSWFWWVVGVVLLGMLILAWVW